MWGAAVRYAIPLLKTAFDIAENTLVDYLTGDIPFAEALSNYIFPQDINKKEEKQDNQQDDS